MAFKILKFLTICWYTIKTKGFLWSTSYSACVVYDKKLCPRHTQITVLVAAAALATLVVVVVVVPVLARVVTLLAVLKRVKKLYLKEKLKIVPMVGLH